jgi:RNA polymerase sigma-70 factor (ECF subfamily)
MPELDDELMERYQQGDENAFTLLVRRHQQPLVNFIARFINDRDSAEDLAQETFIRIFKAANRYKSEGAHFKTWMYHIASNLCKNELRNRGRRNRYRIDSVVDGNGDSEQIDLIENAPADVSSQPDVALERKELHEAIQRAIAELPEQYRVPLVLRDLQGLSYDEISETLELRSGTTKSRINRARLMLKDKLKSYV